MGCLTLPRTPINNAGLTCEFSSANISTRLVMLQKRRVVAADTTTTKEATSQGRSSIKASWSCLFMFIFFCVWLPSTFHLFDYVLSTNYYGGHLYLS